MNSNWKQRIENAITSEDHNALLELARTQVPKVIRYLNSRLYTQDEEEKWRIIRALGIVAADPRIVDDQRAAELLRRFVWALNDESGAVPYGVPEAMGEVLAARPEFQEAFLPMLCSLLTEEEMSQTGPIERGALWAMGRLGPPVARYSAEAVVAVKRAAESHPETATREVASQALRLIRISGRNVRLPDADGLRREAETEL